LWRPGLALSAVVVAVTVMTSSSEGAVTTTPGNVLVSSYYGNSVTLLDGTGTVLANPLVTCPEPRHRTHEVQVDPEGRYFYVAQAGNSQGTKSFIGRYDISTGQFDNSYLLAPFSTAGTPAPIAFTFSGDSVFVAGCDVYNTPGGRETYGIVKEYNRFTGQEISTVVGPAPPWATGVAVSPLTGNVLVSTYRTSLIYEYARSEAGWTEVGSFNGGGAVNGSSGLTFDSDGNLYVANALGGNVLQFAPTSPGWALGNTYTGLSLPESVTIGPDGQLYVADIGAGKIMRYDPDNPSVKSTFASGLSSP
jgi:streptogramin lyase